MNISGMINKWKDSRHEATMEKLKAKREVLGEKAKKTAELRKVKEDIRNIKAYEYKGSTREHMAMALSEAVSKGAKKLKERRTAKLKKTKLAKPSKVEISEGERVRNSLFGSSTSPKAEANEGERVRNAMFGGSSSGRSKGESDGDRARRAIFGR